MTHDRVMRFVPVFYCKHEASRFAISQALVWVGTHAPLLDPLTSNSE
jgi:hypothetical protein